MTNAERAGHVIGRTIGALIVVAVFRQWGWAGVAVSVGLDVLSTLLAIIVSP